MSNIRNKHEMKKIQNPRLTAPAPGFILYSGFEFVSDFGFRVSDFCLYLCDAARKPRV